MIKFIYFAKNYIKDYLNYARLYVRKRNNNQLGERDHAIILNGLISEKIYEKFAEDLGIIINDKSLNSLVSLNSENNSMKKKGNIVERNEVKERKRADNTSERRRSRDKRSIDKENKDTL